ncbi:MAG: efflux RND transporter periplasmic adaptor subunit, partial [Myxococcales bacterium]|nr:efflux RND transporter periplasmic adaptor subunit [Myxococcales bacterium]
MWVFACGGAPTSAKAPEKHEEGGYGEEEGRHEEGGHEEGKGEVHLSAEAIERAGITVGIAERRALTGGVAIPAEIEFDPTGTAHVGPVLSGRFTGLKVALGDRVRRGQLLATVASGDASAARSQMQQAKARLAAAQITLKRQQQLSAEGIGAQRALVDAEAAVAALEAEVDGVRRQLSVFGSGRGGDMQLISPIDGVVVDVLATLGETASADEAAFVVTDPAKV